MSAHDHNHIDTHNHPKLKAERRLKLNQRVKFLVIFTISYNVIEAIVALIAGSVANSSALIGFGLDSTIEVTSAIAIAWQFTAKNPESREKTTLRIIALSFFALAAYVSYDALLALINHEAPDSSTVGIIIAAMSILIMPFVSFIQRKTGEQLGSHSVVADSKQTLLCTYMSVVLLLGLGLNAMLGWWWADAVAALIIAVLATREGIEARRGDACSSAELLFEDGK